MPIVPHVPPATLASALAPASTPGYAGRRWPSLLYPGELARLAEMRHDLRRDLARLRGMSSDSTATIVLCASELFANAVDHTRSGEPDGHLIRTLTMPTATTLRVGVIDDGHRSHPTTPAIPAHRTLGEWEEAERGRGLLLVDHLSHRWGSRTVLDFPFCEGLGTFLWAEFTLDEPE